MDGVKINMLCSNKTENDILCKINFDVLEKKSVNFKIQHTLTRYDKK